MRKIGFIGLGVMGKPMAVNLLKAGFHLTVYNRSSQPTDYLVSNGAQRATSPAALAKSSEVIVIMVADDPQLSEVLFGDSGVIKGVKRGHIIVITSTVSPDLVRKIARRMRKHDVLVLDAPVTGGQAGAQAGTLTFMVGGDRHTYQRCLPIFRAMGRYVTYSGRAGMGEVSKLCNNLVLHLNLLAACEGIVLARKLGVNLKQLIKIMENGAADSWVVRHIGPRIVRRDFEPGGKLVLSLKDTKLALSLAKKAHVPLPGTEVVYRLFDSLADSFGEKGNHILVLALERGVSPVTHK